MENENKKYSDELTYDQDYDYSDVSVPDEYTAEEMIALDNEFPDDDYSDIKIPSEEFEVPDEVISGGIGAGVSAGIYYGQKGIESGLKGYAEDLAAEAAGMDHTTLGKSVMAEEYRASCATKKPFVTKRDIGRTLLDEKAVITDEMIEKHPGKFDPSRKGVARSLLGSSEDVLGPAETLKFQAGTKVGDTIKKIDQTAGKNIINIHEFHEQVKKMIQESEGKFASTDKFEQNLRAQFGETTGVKTFQGKPTIIPGKEIPSETKLVKTGRDTFEEVTTKARKTAKKIIPGQTYQISLPKHITLEEFNKYKQAIKDSIPLNVEDPSQLKKQLKLRKAIVSKLEQYAEKQIKIHTGTKLLHEYKKTKKYFAKVKVTRNIINEMYGNPTESAHMKAKRIALAATFPKTHGPGLIAKGWNSIKGVTAKKLDLLDKVLKDEYKAGSLVKKVGAVGGKMLWKSLPVLGFLATYQTAQAKGLSDDEAIKYAIMTEGAEMLPFVGQALMAVESEELGYGSDIPRGKQLTPEQMQETIDSEAGSVSIATMVSQALGQLDNYIKGNKLDKLEKKEKDGTITEAGRKELEKRATKHWEFSKPKKTEDLKKELKKLNKEELKKSSVPLARAGGTFMSLQGEEIGSIAQSFEDIGLFEYASILKNIAEIENPRKVNAKLYGLWQRPDFRDALQTAIAEARSDTNNLEEEYNAIT